MEATPAKIASGDHPAPRKLYNALFIAPTSFFSDYGHPVRILEEVLALQKRGHRVTIVTYYNGRDIDGLTIERTLPIPRREHYEVGSSRHKIAFDLLLALKTLQVGLRLRPDVIHAHIHEGALVGALLSRLIRAPLVMDFQGSLTAEMVDHRFIASNGRAFRFFRWLETKIDHLPDAILTSSRQATDLLCDEFGCPPAKIHPLPDCVNAERFRPGLLTPQQREALRSRWQIPPGARVVVYLGLLADYQGTALLVDAIHRLVKKQGRRDLHFLIMGYPGVEGYQAYARQRSIAEYVTFTGRVPYEQAPQMLALGEVAVAPKISATEGSGKVLNYMAMGLPTVAFDTPVHQEYLGDLGLYAEAGCADALAGALALILDDQDRARRLSARLRERAQTRFSWDQAGARIEQVYNLVCRSV